MCLGEQVVELDLPFHIVVNTADGEERKGFVKARRIYDGCTETTVTRRKAEAGGEVRLEPMQAQIILGGDDIKAGMTAWEMPQIGLNVGAGGGITGFMGDIFQNIGPTVHLAQEYSLASLTGVSELHQYLKAGIGLMLDAQPAVPFLRPAVGPDVGAWVEDELSLVAEADIGILKRWYANAFFFEVGIGASVSYYLLKERPGYEDFDITLIGAGGHALLGIGFQLAPRWMLRFQGGVRAGVIIPSITDDYDQDVTALTTYAMEAQVGPMANLGLLYTF